MSNGVVTMENFKAEKVAGLTDRMKVMLQALRYIVDEPIYITSGLRSSDTDSEHSLGMGVDISDNNRGEDISSRWRYKVMKAAYGLGFRRLGDYDRHVHLGVSTSHPQDVEWRGVSS